MGVPGLLSGARSQAKPETRQRQSPIGERRSASQRQRSGETLFEQDLGAAALRAEIEADRFVRALADALPCTVPGQIRTLASMMELSVTLDEAREAD